MAKDGTNRGGARVGAGAKKKPLADKIAEGNHGRRQLTVVNFENTADLEGQPMPKPSAMLSATQSEGWKAAHRRRDLRGHMEVAGGAELRCSGFAPASGALCHERGPMDSV